MVRDFTFPRSERLRRQADFDRVHRANWYAADGVLVVRGASNDLPYSRIGVSLSRKVGPAVLRNRWKRLIREAFRLERDRIPRGLDLVVRPRRGAHPSAAAIRHSLVKLTIQLARRCG
jgi:ribonuclease P protein component